MALIERLSWDSTFFGFPVGKLNAETLSRAQLEQVEDKVRELGIRCLYWDAGCGDYESAQAAAASSFVPIEVRVLLSLKDGHEFEQQPQDLSPIEDASARDLPQLVSIAEELSEHSRFRLDPNFPADAGKRLYRVWIEKSLGGYADRIVIARRDNRAVGFVTCRFEDGTGKLELVAVANDQCGQGYGAALVHEACNGLREQGVQRIDVVTQGHNVAAQRFYQGCGFRTFKVSTLYHAWFE